MADGDIRVQDEQGTVHVFPAGSTPQMIAQVMHVSPPVNAGLAAPVGPSRSVSYSEGPIARTLTSFETQISKAPGATWNFLKDAAHGFPADTAENERVLSGQETPEDATVHAVHKINPVVSTPEGIDWGATGANLLPLLIDAGGEGITESPAGMVTRELSSTLAEKVPPVVRAGVRSANTALKNPTVAGGTGTAVGATIGHATGVPYAPEIGGVLGGIAGRKYLPKITIPGEGFGLPSRVTGGPASAPPYIATPDIPAVFPGAPLPEAIGPEVAQARPIGTGAQAATEPSEALGTIPRAQSEVLNDRLRQPQPSTPLDRLRDQPIAPAQPDFEPIRPSIERIMPPEDGEGGITTGTEPVPQAPAGSGQAFRSRSVGEQGIPFNAKSPAQASMSQTEAEGILPHRESMTGQPQQLISVDLGKTPGFSTMAGPRGNDWVKFHGPVGEDAVTPINVPMPDTSPKAVEQQIGNALGATPAPKIVPGVTMRGQAAAQAAAASGIPEGFTKAVSEGGRESDALKGYKYDPEAREFTAITKEGRSYTHGDVSPEEFADFENAKSKGKAWQKIKNNPLVAKEGQPVKPAGVKTEGGTIPKSKAGLNLKFAGVDVPADADLSAPIAEAARQAELRRKRRAE